MFIIKSNTNNIQPHRGCIKTFNKHYNLTHYSEIITINPEVRFGKPCIRGIRIAVCDIIGWLPLYMNSKEIRENSEFTEEDIKAAIAFNIG